MSTPGGVVNYVTKRLPILKLLQSMQIQKVVIHWQQMLAALLMIVLVIESI
jgi:hypothetical protein